MAIAATRLDPYRLAYNASNLDAYEHRLSNYGAFETFMGDTANLIPGFNDLTANRTSPVRTVSIPVINRKNFTSGSVRTCDALTHELTSAFVTPSWSTYKVGFNMIPAQYKNNYLSYQDAFNNKMLHLQRDILEDMDTLAHTALNTNKSQVNNAAGNPYTVVANDMQVAAADNQLFLNELGQIFAQNDLPQDSINVVSSPRFQALVREYSSQGTSNAENRAFQFGGQNFAYSNRVTVAAGDRDSVYAMPQGSLAFLNWVDIDAQMGHKATDGGEWSTFFLPLVGIPVGVYYNSVCSNQGVSGTARATGLEATLSESWMFSFDYSFNVAYNSDATTLPGVIYKSQLSQT